MALSNHPSYSPLPPPIANLRIIFLWGKKLFLPFGLYAFILCTKSNVQCFLLCFCFVLQQARTKHKNEHTYSSTCEHSLSFHFSLEFSVVGSWRKFTEFVYIYRVYCRCDFGMGIQWAYILEWCSCWCCYSILAAITANAAAAIAAVCSLNFNAYNIFFYEIHNNKIIGER